MKLDIYKITKIGKKVHIRTLCYNNRVWNGHQWLYGYVTDNYPSEHEAHAKDFGTVKEARKWIKEHIPS